MNKPIISVCIPTAFCDPVLSGLAGVELSDGGIVEINPLFTKEYDCFCADGVLCNGKYVTVLWDKTGERYKKGKGFKVLVDKEPVFAAEMPCKTEIML